MQVAAALRAGREIIFAEPEEEQGATRAMESSAAAEPAEEQACHGEADEPMEASPTDPGGPAGPASIEGLTEKMYPICVFFIVT